MKLKSNNISNSNLKSTDISNNTETTNNKIKSNKSVKFQTITSSPSKDNEKVDILSKFNKSNMLVVVRKRPMNNKEKEINSNSVVQISNGEKVTLLDLDSVINQGNSKNTMPKHQHFFFDYSFDEESSQEEVYSKTTKFLLEDLIQGFNATVLAHGATGCGKTYTMVGTPDNQGIMVRSLSDLFSLKDKKESEGIEIKISMSYVEVYNETILDLMIDKSQSVPLDLYEDSSKSIIINGVTIKIVNNANEVFELLTMGNKNRTEDSTDYNQVSSRSHAILSIFVESRPKNNISGQKSVIGKFLLVDLAGSEKASYNKASGIKTLEGANINKSLLALSNCISALVDKKPFIPWRNSKLTRILQDSLGGNSRIVLIANISPSVMSYDENLYTLKYANRAKNIKKEVHQNIINDEKKIKKYEEVIKSLQDEIEDAKSRLREKQSPSGFFSTQKNFEFNSENTELIESFQQKLNEHFQEEIAMKKDVNEVERLIETIKYNTSEGYIKLSYDKTNTKLASDLNKQEVEKEKLEEKAIDLYGKYSNITGKRKLLQKEFIKFNAKPTSLKLIMDYYMYYVTLIDNMTINQREFISKNQKSIQEMQIKELIKQVEYRDQVLSKLNDEFRKKNIVYKPDGVREYRDFSREPLRLPQIIPFENIDAIKDNLLSKEEKSDLKYSKPSQLNTSKKAIKPIRSFQYELNFKRKENKINYPLHLNPNKYSMKLSQNMSNSLNKSRESISTPRNIQNNNISIINRSNNHSMKDTVQSNSKSWVGKGKNIFDKQRHNMVKTLIRRDIIGRYRGSPYLK